MNGIDTDFKSWIEQWAEYCRTPEVILSSDFEKVKRCYAYVCLRSMDTEIFPLIRELYKEDSSKNLGLSVIQSHGLVQLVMDIAGDNFQIPKDIKGNIQGMKEYTRHWLDEYSN